MICQRNLSIIDVEIKYPLCGRLWSPFFVIIVVAAFWRMNFLQVLRSTCTVAAQGRFVENLTIKQMAQRRKYKCLYRYSFENGFQAKTGIGHLTAHDNAKRFKSIHGILPPIAAFAPKANPVGITA